MPIRFKSGNGDLNYIKINIPFPWYCIYHIYMPVEQTLMEYDLDSLVEGGKVWEGRSCYHLKFKSMNYRPADSTLSIIPSIVQQSLCLPAKTINFLDKPSASITAGLTLGHYEFQNPRQDWGGCVENLSLDIYEEDNRYNLGFGGYFTCYPGWSIPRGTPITVSFRTYGDQLFVHTDRAGVQSEYYTEPFSSLYTQKYVTSGTTRWPEYGDVYHQLRAMLTLDWDPPEQHCMCVRQAINDLDVIGINWYEALGAFAEKTLQSLGQIGERILQHLESAKSATGLQAAKIVSNAYLSKKYGLDNDVRDIASLRSGIPELWSMIQQEFLALKGQCSSSWSNPGSDGIITSNCTVYCQPFLSGRVWDDVLGITPSASNLWAVVPFSFAIDWVLHCADNLSQIETAAGFGSNRWHVSHIWYCDKAFGTSPSPDFAGWVPEDPEYQWTMFNRSCEDSLPDYVYDPPDYGLHGLKDHVFETVALILNAF